MKRQQQTESRGQNLMLQQHFYMDNETKTKSDQSRSAQQFNKTQNVGGGPSQSLFSPVNIQQEAILLELPKQQVNMTPMTNKKTIKPPIGSLSNVKQQLFVREILEDDEASEPNSRGATGGGMKNRRKITLVESSADRSAKFITSPYSIKNFPLFRNNANSESKLKKFDSNQESLDYQHQAQRTVAYSKNASKMVKNEQDETLKVPYTEFKQLLPPLDPKLESTQKKKQMNHVVQQSKGFHPANELFYVSNSLIEQEQAAEYCPFKSTQQQYEMVQQPSRKQDKRGDGRNNVFQPSGNSTQPRINVIIPAEHRSPQQRPQESHSQTRSNMKLKYPQTTQKSLLKSQTREIFIDANGRRVNQENPLQVSSSSMDTSKKINKQATTIQKEAQKKTHNVMNYDTPQVSTMTFPNGFTQSNQRHHRNSTILCAESLGKNDFNNSDSVSFSEPDYSHPQSFNVERRGKDDSEDDVRLYRDIQIRLKIEPLSQKLMQSITDRIRVHLENKGKNALSNMIGLLYQQTSKLTQKEPVDQSKAQQGIIKQLQEQNAELDQQRAKLNHELQALRSGVGSSHDSSEAELVQSDILKQKNKQLKLDIELLRDLLPGDQSSRKRFSEDEQQIVKFTVKKVGVPKLNLQKALQVNMKMFKTQFQVPMESSDRGSYMSFKLQQNHTSANAEEEDHIPVAVIHKQQLTRPTTAMGGRKKIVIINKGNQFQEVIESSTFRRDELQSIEAMSDHSAGSGGEEIDEILKRKKKSTQFEEMADTSSSKGGKHKSLKKVIHKVQVAGFHDEFMAKYDEFSLSWREAIDKEKRF